MKKRTALGFAVATALFCAVPITLIVSPAKTPALALDTANAKIGRPPAPMSVAGVNRRVHRRSTYGAAATGFGAYRLDSRAARAPCGFAPYLPCY